MTPTLSQREPTGAADGPDWRRTLFDPFVLLPAIVSVVLLAAGNEDFGFDGEGGIDASMFLGYFWHYPEHAGALALAYKMSRLPWILPGYAVHSIAGAVAGAYLLAFASLCAGGVALYLLVRDATRDRAAAAVVCVAWTACTWIHGNGGWSYHALAAADYFLFGTWLTFRAASERSAVWAVLGGACVICAVHTHLFFAALLPLVPLTYWSGLTPRAETVSQALRDALRAAGGAFGITLLLAVVNVATGGRWLFFLSQIGQTQALLQHDRWWLGTATWLPMATYLVVPAVFIIAGLAALLISHAVRESRPVRLLVVQACLASGIMCFAQSVGNVTTLDHGYMTLPLYAHAFPAGAVILTTRQKHQPLVSILGSSAIIVGALLLLMPSALPAAMNTFATAALGPGMGLVLPPFLFGLVGCAATLIAPAKMRLWVFGAWFAALNAWIAPGPTSYGINTSGHRRQMFELFYEFDGLTAAYDPSLNDIHYWFTGDGAGDPHPDISLRSVFDSLVAIRGGESMLVGHDPAVPLGQVDLNDLHLAECIGLLTAPDATARIEAEWQAHFTALGRPLRRVTVRRFIRPDIAFDLTLVKPADAKDVGGPPCMHRRPPRAPRQL